MEAIVLAGGFGTRLRQVVPDLPKPMAPVAGRPFLEIVLTMLARKGFGRAILSLGHMADKIVSHFGGRFAKAHAGSFFGLGRCTLKNIIMGTSRNSSIVIASEAKQSRTHCKSRQ